MDVEDQMQEAEMSRRKQDIRKDVNSIRKQLACIPQSQEASRESSFAGKKNSVHKTTARALQLKTEGLPPTKPAQDLFRQHQSGSKGNLP